MVLFLNKTITRVGFYKLCLPLEKLFFKCVDYKGHREAVLKPRKCWIFSKCVVFQNNL